MKIPGNIYKAGVNYWVNMEIRKTAMNQNKIELKKKKIGLVTHDVKTSWQKEESVERMMELKGSHRLRNRIETPEVNIYIASFFSSRTLRHTHWKRCNLCNKWCWGNWTGTLMRLELELWFWVCVDANNGARV